ncbi:MAG: UDP-N-acetylmuramate--L-alanine ligase [Spirochaetaceae bacterium]|nr:UDP-N-acetylmuramate--L-alanine ligase [Spirochaetaceae bacterium]
MNTFQMPDNIKGLHIHFIGIKGTGMAALTEIFHARGAKITGSDVSDIFYTDKVLESCGIKPLLFDSANITNDISFIIYSSAYNSKTNCELAQAEKLSIPCLLYSQALGQLSRHTFSCGVAGVHGKTTTTGLVGTVAKVLNIPVQVLAGSVISSFGQSNEHGSCTISCGQDYFVAETCEYQRHFMDFKPKKIILTSVESDHQDYYPTYDDIRTAFFDYCNLLPSKGDLIYCADDAGASEVASMIASQRSDINLIPYGETASGNWKVTIDLSQDGKQIFSLAGFGDFKFAINVPGKHLVLNSTAAVALCCSLLCHQKKCNLEESFSVEIASKILKGLELFKGGKRRSEIIGRVSSVIFLDDYAHHPTAIRTTLEGYRNFYPGRKLIVDFMSHTYTRTASLLDDFAQSFDSAHQVILHKIYASAREKPSEASVTGETLYNKTKLFHNNVCYYQDFLDAENDLLTLLSKPDPEFPNGYVFVTMGAGDNWKLGRILYEKMSKIGVSI